MDHRLLERRQSHRPTDGRQPPSTHGRLLVTVGHSRSPLVTVCSPLVHRVISVNINQSVINPSVVPTPGRLSLPSVVYRSMQPIRVNSSLVNNP